MWRLSPSIWLRSSARTWSSWGYTPTSPLTMVMARVHTLFGAGVLSNVPPYAPLRASCQSNCMSYFARYLTAAKNETVVIGGDELVAGSHFDAARAACHAARARGDKVRRDVGIRHCAANINPHVLHRSSSSVKAKEGTLRQSFPCRSEYNCNTLAPWLPDLRVCRSCLTCLFLCLPSPNPRMAMPLRRRG